MKKTCPVCGEARREGDSGRWMCDLCHAGLALDISRAKALPSRLRKAVRAFWKAATTP